MRAPTFPVLEVAWVWGWVPQADAPADVVDAWRAETTEQFARWASAGVADLLAAAPAELGGTLTPQELGAEVATWLHGRTAGLPAWTHVVWGAVFVEPERPRWVPVVATVEVREPAGEDSTYLMDAVGHTGLPGDARPPLVDYVTTDAGDGVRVTALVRGEHGEAFARVDGALRLDATAWRGPLDVLVSVRVSELALFGLVGAGVEELMQLIAAGIDEDIGGGVAPRAAAPGTNARSVP